MIFRNKNQSGFALLMTLVVVSVVVSVALTLIDLTIKQLRLSTGSKDSENAFHAANAGVECIRYWRVKEGEKFEKGTGDSVNMTCFNDSDNAKVDNISPVGVPDSVFMYSEIQFDWGVAGEERCSEAIFITASTSPTSAGVTLTNVKNYIPSYPENEKTCDPGGLCTIILVQGYNHSCSTNYPLGTIQREVLLEL